MTTTPTKKTIYFIRHAESEENRRLHSLKNAALDVVRLAWPKPTDMQAVSELWHLSDQLDSPVSEFGKKQIAHMAGVLKEANFISRVQLVVHSPLIRARETSFGMLGCKAPDTTVPGITKVIELELLREKTPGEWVSGSNFRKRISDWEEWVARQTEASIAVVGHSQYFRAVLGMQNLMGNCDVLKAEFTPSQEDGTPASWSTPEDVHLCRLDPPASAQESS